MSSSAPTAELSNPSLSIECDVAEELLEAIGDWYTVAIWYGVLTVHAGDYSERPLATLTKDGVSYRNRDALEELKRCGNALTSAAAELDRTREAWVS